MKTQKRKIRLHGEVMWFDSTIPADAVKINPSNTNYHIVADSETTGNHHVLDCPEGVEIYQSGNRIYLNSKVDTNIRCVHENRHDTIPISPGVYEFGNQQEYDHDAQNKRNVKD